MFKDLISGTSRMNAMQAGMVQYNNEIKNKGIVQSLDLENNEITNQDTNPDENNDKDKNKGFDLNI